ncbi:MAG: cobalamin-binding protein [Burkholderiaceae bacterium]|nr:cobalamin-binding protein [Burkholderiaceae bacterium]
MRALALAWCVLTGANTAVAAPVAVQDDASQTVSLPAPAQRIVSLSPHATELLFAAGAGTHVVGVSEYSDYPAQASRLPSVGSSTTLDLERILALKPDLIVTWKSGNSAAQVAKLQVAGIAVFASEPRSFADIASSLERLGKLAGTQQSADAAANAFRSRWQQLSTQYAGRPEVSVFYQIWRDPLMTLNDSHLVSAAIRLCGGRNVFGKLPTLAPTVNTEAVLLAAPEAIVTGSGAKDDDLAPWRAFTQIPAVKRNNLFSVNADVMTRGTPRILDGTEALCKQLDQVRARRGE